MEFTARIVEYGVDMDNERVDPEWCDGALVKWMDGSRAITMDFTPEAIGHMKAVEHDEIGWIGTGEIFDENLVYPGSGFGIAIKNFHVVMIDGVGVIDGGEIIEVSLTSNPMRYSRNG